MRFGAPVALLLLLFVPYLIWLGRPNQPKARREWLALALRLSILVLVTLSLAEVRLVRAADDLAVVFLLDASDSVGPVEQQQAEEFVRDAVERIGPDEQAAVVVFGANALVDRPMSRLAELAPVATLPQTIHTDVAEAIRLGLALFPAGSARRIVLFSDGYETLGDAHRAAELAAASGVVIDVVSLSGLEQQREVILRDVTAPASVREGESFDVDVTVQSTVATDALIQVLTGGSLVYSETVSLNPGINSYVIRLQATEQQFARYVVQIVSDDDGFYQNNRLAIFTNVEGPPSVLLVSGEGGPPGVTDQQSVLGANDWQQLQLALEATGINFDRVMPSEMPADLESLSNYDSIVMVNVNAEFLSQRNMEALQGYVRDLGGGLVVIGGPESYGMGGYYRTPLEEILPVEMQIKDQERFPEVSMALVIDRSGSMSAKEGSLSKIQLAAEGAARTVELLNDFDEITILPVDTAPDAVIGPVTAADRESIISQVRQLGAGGGGIYVRTGLEAAAEALRQSTNQIKHIILLADGADSEQKEGVPELIEALAAEGVTVSTVSIGDGPDVPWLREMAGLGGGRFHFTDRAANLPQIFTQETTAIQRSYLVEERFFPALGSSSFARQHPLFQSMERSGITRVPPLYGYVGTSPKQTAQMILETHLGDPLLSVWEYGLGRAVAWTSDATGRWGVDWVGWQGFPTFWSNIVRWTINKDSGSNLETEVGLLDDEAILTVEARDGNDRLLNDLSLEATVISPAGDPGEITLQQIGPGRYEASFLPDEEGAYLIRVAGQRQTDGVAIGQTTGWVLGYSPEYEQLGGNRQLLEAVAQLSNGRDITAQFERGAFDAVLNHDLQAAATSQPIWPWLLLMAILILPLDIAVRRIAISRDDGQRIWQSTIGRLRRGTVARPASSEQVTRLFRAKERAGRRQNEDEVGYAQPKDQPDVAEQPERFAPDAVTGSGAEPDRAAEKDQGAEGSEPPTNATSETLASRLLERRKRSESGDVED